MTNLSKNEAVALLGAIIVLGITFVGTRFNPFIVEAPQNGSVATDTVALPNVKTEPTAAYQAIASAVDSRGTVTKLITEDSVIGTGTIARVNDTVTVHYVGMLQDGTEFYNSHTKNDPYTFVLGTGKVIKGWDEGLVGMKVGGTRIVVIPADKAYGNRQVGPIPPNSTLIFSLELMDAK